MAPLIELIHHHFRPERLKKKKHRGKKIKLNGYSKQYSSDLHIWTCWVCLCCKPLPSGKLQSWSCLFTMWIMTEELVRPITMSNDNFSSHWFRMITSSLSLTVKTRHLLTSCYLYCCSQLPIRQVPLHWSYYMIWEHLFLLLTGREARDWAI